jgi:hypothetical protein
MEYEQKDGEGFEQTYGTWTMIQKGKKQYPPLSIKIPYFPAHKNHFFTRKM